MKKVFEKCVEEKGRNSHYHYAPFPLVLYFSPLSLLEKGISESQLYLPRFLSIIDERFKEGHIIIDIGHRQYLRFFLISSG